MHACDRAVFAGSVFGVYFFWGVLFDMRRCMWLFSYCDSHERIMHGSRPLCTVFSVLRQLSHRKAALTLPLRAGSQQLPVKYGDLYAWLSNGITYGGRRLTFFRF